MRENFIADQLWTLRLTPIHTLHQEILLAAHDPITGNPTNLETLVSKPWSETSSDSPNSPPPILQTNTNMSGAAAAVPAIHVLALSLLFSCQNHGTLVGIGVHDGEVVMLIGTYSVYQWKSFKSIQHNSEID
jgi:hypothetical protein